MAPLNKIIADKQDLEKILLQQIKSFEAENDVKVEGLVTTTAQGFGGRPVLTHISIKVQNPFD